jgi:hypothetical protein
MSFLTGFAKSLQGSLAKDSDAAREMEKQRMLMELQKKYEAEIVRADLTTVEGDGAGGFKEVRRNQYGDTINERVLSPEEAEERKAELDRVKAASRAAIAGADSAEFQAENQEEVFSLDMEAKRANIEQSRASAASSREAAESSRFSRSRAKTEEDRKVQDAAAQLEGMLASIEQGPDVSDEAQAQAIRAKLDAATASIDDPDLLRREIIKLTAQASRINTRARTLDSTRPSTSGGSILNRIRSLDEDDENFSVVPGGR